MVKTHPVALQSVLTPGPPIDMYFFMGLFCLLRVPSNISPWIADDSGKDRGNKAAGEGKRSLILIPQVDRSY